jgi:hypothetical protein
MCVLISSFFSLITTRMFAVTTLQFTQEQARLLTGVSSETIRHWRRVLPYLAGKPGKAARFTFADVVGLAATCELVERFGVRIASIKVGVNNLFERLADTRPTMLEDSVAVLEPAEARLFPIEELHRHRLDGAAWVVPLEPLISRLRRNMLPTAVGEEQRALPFLPKVVRSGR